MRQDRSEKVHILNQLRAIYVYTEEAKYNVYILPIYCYYIKYYTRDERRPSRLLIANGHLQVHLAPLTTPASLT